jgi:DNA-binding NarL/FixJ family response regulator
MEIIKVAMVDDHKIVRDGIRAMFMADNSIQVVAEAGDAEAMLKLLYHVQPHILILDINLPDMDGNIMAMEVKQKYPDIKVLMLSASGDEGTVLCALKAGVKGYLTKECDADEFLEAVHTIAGGDEYFGDKVSRIIYKSYKKMLDSADTSEQKAAKGLTLRETDVLKGFAEGLSYKEIGEKLFISPRTVETHKSSIMDKLDLKSVADLVKYALRNGLVKLN